MKPELDLTSRVAEAAEVDHGLATRVIPMFEEGFTVPFIARYRKELTGGLEPSTLHRLKQKINEVKHFFEKMDKSYEFLKKSGNMNDNLSQQLKLCKTMDDLKLLVSY